MSDHDLIRRGDALVIAQGMNNGKTAKAIARAIAALPAVTVGVKRLMWEDDDCAEIMGLRYILCDPSTSDETNGWYVLEETTNTVIEADGSPDAAKAAAQADYTARILAALEPVTPAPDAAAIMEAGPNHAYRVGFAAGRAAALREAAEVCKKNAEAIRQAVAFPSAGVWGRPRDRILVQRAQQSDTDAAAILALITEKPHDRA